MMKKITELWKREKRKIAILLAVCCIAAGVAELPFPGVQAAGVGMLETETSAPLEERADGTETAFAAEGTEAVIDTETTAGTETETVGTEMQENFGTEDGMEAVEDTETEEETEAVEETETEEETEAVEETETEEETEAVEETETVEGTEAVEEAETTEGTEAVEDTETAALKGLRGTPIDRTEETAELKIVLEELYVLNTQDGNIVYKTGSDGGNTIYDVSESAYYDIGKVKFKVSFRVLKGSDSEGGNRTLKEGDYFIYRIPEGFELNSKFTNDSVVFGGVPIAVYEKGTDADGAEIIKFTFQEAVNGDKNYNNIAGGMNLELDFDSSVLEGGGNKLVQLLPVRSGGTGIQLKLPEEPSVVNGIEKSGVHNTTDNTITWTLKVGTETESKGMSLNGLILEDVMGDGQAYVPGSAKLVNADGTTAPGTVLAAVSGNTVTCALEGDDIKAPCYVQLQTAITKEKLEEAKASATQPASMQFTNAASMKPPADGSLTIGSKSDANVAINAQFGTQITKKGEQIDSNTIHWTIEVNNTNPRVHVYHGVVTDELMQGLSYKAGSMTFKIDGGSKQTPGVMGGTTTPWPGNSLEVTGNPDTRQTLKFYLAETSKNQYTIEFDTTVPDGFTGNLDGDGNAIVTNDAAITAELPYWTGSGPEYVPWDYGIPGINCVFDSSLIEKKVSADEKTGILTWTIFPSTRTVDYDTAVITDAIEPKQEYIAGTLNVEKKDGTLIGAGINIDVADSKNFKITIPKNEGTPGDYVITYQTKGLNYFTENFENKTYTNTAVLDIMKGGTSLAKKTADAKTDMINRFLAKSTSFEYINNVGYFHYTIDVNGNKMTLNNVVITDDLNDCVFVAKAEDGTEVIIPSSAWEFDAALCETKVGGVIDNTRKPVVNGTEVNVNLGTISDKYTIHLYAKLTNTALLTDLTNAGLANKKVYSTNTVKANSTEVAPSAGGSFSVTSASKDKNVFMDNTLVTKNVASFDKTNGLITWNVVINPHGGPLSNAVLTDELPKSAKYVAGSVILYDAVYNASGKLVKGTQAAVQPQIGFSVDKTSRFMTVTLGVMTNGTYILEYQTAVVDNSQPSVTNEVSVGSGADNYGLAKGKMELTGGNWGTLSTAGKLEITKYDASVGASMPLAGAEFTVYSDAACTDTVDMGETNASGKLLLYGLEAGTGNAGTLYYFKETKAPSGAYVENTEVYEVLIKRGETAKITVENKRKTTAAATKAEVIKQYKYTGDALPEQIVTDRQSSFELYFFPYGIDKVTGKLNTIGSKKVLFKENSVGDYLYSGDGTVSSVKNKTTDGSIVFTGLPWGYYGLKETKVPEGFAAYSDMKYFEIGFEEVSGGFTVDYYFNNADTTDFRITNESTAFSVKKFLKGTTDYLSGVTLQICEKAADGTLTVVTNPVTGAAYEWKTDASEASAGHLVRNLPQGSYVLHEVADQTVPTLSIAEDIPFTVDMYGALKQAGKAVTELTMYDAKNTLTIRKEDQFKDAVDGAEITVTGPDTVSPGGYSKTISTVDGTAVFEDLIRGGLYTVSETKVPDGYKLAESIKIRVSDDGKKCYIVKSDGTETEVKGSLVMVDRKLLVQVKVSKTDAFSGEQLKGAEFSLFRTADIPGGTDTRLLDGIQMTVHPAGSKEWIGWDIADTAGSVNNPFTSKPLKEGLNAGSYCLVETKVPDGYKEAPKTEFEVTVDGELRIVSTDHARISEDNQERIEVQDEPLTLRIEKYDAGTMAALTGAEYKITGMFAGEIAETTKVLKTDAPEQKNALSGKLLPGNVYTINETKAPLGYQSILTAYFMLDAAGNVTVTDAAGTPETREDVKAVNPADEKNGTDGSLQIYDKKIIVDFVKCKSEDGTPINGASFTVEGVFADGTIEKVISPTEAAPAELAGLLIEENTYTLTEEAPAGYLPLAGSVSFTYTADHGLELTAGSDSHAAVFHASPDGSGYAKETLVITNDPGQNTSLQFIKYDREDNSGIAGAVFELVFIPEGSSVSQTSYYTVPDEGTVYEYVTAGEVHRKVTAAGEAFLADLGRGTYTLTEITSPYAYELGEQAFSCTFTVDNRSMNKTIAVNQTNAGMNAYDLAIVAGEDLLTDKGIVNERMTGSVTLVKVDALDQTKLLNGVGFTVYRYKDRENVIDWFRQLFTGNAYETAEAQWTESVDEDGKLTIQGLPWGRYYIVETKPLEHYVLDDTKYEFTIGKDQVTQVLDWTPGKNITNAKTQMVIGQETTGGAITVGNRIRIYGRFANYSGNYIEWTVEDVPRVIAGELLEGEEYLLMEVAPYEGYTSAKELKFLYSQSGIKLLSGTEDAEFTVDADGTFRLVQKVPPIRVSFEKVDEAGKLLSGAGMRLTYIKADGTTEVIKEWKSADEAMKMEGVLLSGGNYILSETKAPKGYELAEDISFKVSDSSDWQNLTMTDKKEVPKDTETESTENPGTESTENTENTESTENPGTESTENTENPGTESTENTESTEKPQPGGADVSGGGTGADMTTDQKAAETAENNVTKLMLPKTEREARTIYYFFGAIFILAGIILCMTGMKKQSNKEKEN